MDMEPFQSILTDRINQLALIVRKTATIDPISACLPRSLHEVLSFDASQRGTAVDNKPVGRYRSPQLYVQTTSLCVSVDSIRIESPSQGTANKTRLGGLLGMKGWPMSRRP